MPTAEAEKRPKGFRALSAFRPSALRSSQRKEAELPPPDDESHVQAPSYSTADAVSSALSDKHLPQLPPAIIGHDVQEGIGMTASLTGATPDARRQPTSMPVPAEAQANTMRSSAGPMNRTVRGGISATNIPHSPKPIRPPSIPVAEHIATDEPQRNADRDGSEPGTLFPAEPESVSATVSAHRGPREPKNVGTEGDGQGPEPLTPFGPIDTPAVPAALNEIHFNCYQEHRLMLTASNVWYPAPCMTCHKHDREDRCRCVFCCLRICSSCFQILQRCQRRSLKELMEELQR